MEINQKSFTLPNFSKKKLGGFTLVEILVVTSIILILTSLTLPYYRAGERQFTLQRSASKLAQDIRRAQQMAMSAKEVGPAEGKIIPAGGYGIYLRSNPDEIIIFADCDNNQSYTPGNVCGQSPNKFPEKIEEIKLEPKIKIKDLFPSSPLEITFRPPDPEVFISGGNLGQITISLEEEPTKSIKVNNAGLINVE